MLMTIKILTVSKEAYGNLTGAMAERTYAAFYSKEDRAIGVSFNHNCSWTGQDWLLTGDPKVDLCTWVIV